MLDTNAWLDLLVFRDPRAARLDAALRSGAVVAVTDDACRDEWLRVLRYPQLALGEAAREELVAGFDRLGLKFDLPPPAVALPRCADPDDQKFLELAAATSARWLVSRDRALLALARRAARMCGFAIVTPEQWSEDTAADAGSVSPESR